MQEIQDLRRSGERPREHIQQVQRRDGAEVRKDRIHPHHAEHARAEDDDHRGHKAAPDAAAGGDGAVHKRADGVRPPHDLQPLHPGGDDRRFVREQV